MWPSDSSGGESSKRGKARVRAAKGTGDAAGARRCGEGDQLQDEAESGEARDDSGAHAGTER